MRPLGTADRFLTGGWLRIDVLFVCFFLVGLLPRYLDMSSVLSSSVIPAWCGTLYVAIAIVGVGSLLFGFRSEC
jgi:hypothetical protein